MAFAGGRLSSTRAQEVEARLQARADQLRQRGTPLGCCRECGAIVYAGDSLAMSGVSLLHGQCLAGGDDRNSHTA